MSARILLVEDEEHLLEGIKLNLELEGYEVVALTSGIKALDTFRNERFNLIILDVMLPEMDGFQVCERIRLENKQIPILFLTAKNAGQDVVTGLKKGGDDYLTKPFNLEELLLRVQILIRRGAIPVNPISDEVYIGNAKINFSSFEVTKPGQAPFQLTRREIMLLKLLMERKNEVVSRETILETVWGYNVYPSTRTIDNFISSFRKYFEDDPRESRHFHSIRGVGYKFTE